METKQHFQKQSGKKKNGMWTFCRQTSSFISLSMSLKWKWTCLYLFPPALNQLQCFEMTACRLQHFKSWLQTLVFVYSCSLTLVKKPKFDFFLYRWEAGSPRENFYQVDKHAFEESENCLLKGQSTYSAFDMQQKANPIWFSNLYLCLVCMIFSMSRPITATEVLTMY